VRQVGHLLRLYSDARSAKHQNMSVELVSCISRINLYVDFVHTSTVEDYKLQKMLIPMEIRNTSCSHKRDEYFVTLIFA
jgi:hypothetical protein